MAQNEVPITKYHEISRKYGDPWIWGIFIMLMIISIIESYSASSREVAKVGLYAPLIKQCLFLGVGALLAIGLLQAMAQHTVASIRETYQAVHKTISMMSDSAAP